MSLKIERLTANITVSDISSQFRPTIEPDRSLDERLYISLDRQIYSLNKSDGNLQSLIQTEERIISFRHIYEMKFLVKDQSTIRVISIEKNHSMASNILACMSKLPSTSNCALRANDSLGPTAVDYSNSDEVYLSVDSAIWNKLPQKVELSDQIIGSISSMTFDKTYSKLYIILETHKVGYIDQTNASLSSFTLVKGKPAQITTAVNVDENAILCQTNKNTLILLDPYSGQYSHVHEGLITLPCSDSGCDKAEKIIALASDSNRNQQLYALDREYGLVSLYYNVSILSVYNGKQPETARASEDETPSLSHKYPSENQGTKNWKIGTLSTSLPAVLGAFVAIIYGCVQKNKARKRQDQRVRMSRWRARQQDSVEFIEEVSDREVANVDPTDVEESNSESTESQLQSGISTAERGETHLKNRPLPPIPQRAVKRPTTHCVQIENQNIDEDEDIPYYVEFLEYVDRPIMLEAHVPNQPCLSPNPSPSTSQTYYTVKDLSQHSLPSTSNPQRNHCSSYLNDSEYSDYYSTREDESPYCDNHCYVPDSDTSDDLYDFHISEPPQQEQREQQQQQEQEQPQQQLLRPRTYSLLRLQQQHAEDEQYLYYTILCFLTLSVLYFLRTQS